MLYTTSISSKGQTTVPIDIREELGAKPGDQLVWRKDEDGRITVRAKNKSIWDLQGMVPKPKKPVSIAEMNRVIAQMGRMNNGRP